MSHATTVNLRHAKHKHMHRRVRRAHAMSLAHAKKALKVAGWVVVGLTVTVWTAQLLWPSDRALPYMTVGQQSVGLMHRGAIASELEKLDQEAVVTLRTFSMDHKRPWNEIGIKLDISRSTEKTLEYPLSQRIVPFSSVMRIYESRDSRFVTTVDEPTLEAFIKNITEQDRQAAVNAAIKVRSGKVEVSPAEAGYSYDPKDVLEQIRHSTYKDQTVINLNPKITQAMISSKAAKQAASKAEAIMETKLVLAAAGQSAEPTARQIGTWLRFVEHKNSSELTVVIDKKKIEEYLTKTLATEVYRAPGTTLIRLLDGDETSRSAGSAGRAIDLKKSTSLVIARLQDNQSGTLDLKLSKLSPSVHYDRNYTFTSKGLLTLLKDWDVSNPGIYGIVVRDLSGTGLQASINPDRDFITASTFKMFLAYAVLNKVESGQISLKTKTDMGWTVDACMKEMILNSTNACAVSLLNLVGWGYADNFVRGNGFPATYLNNGITYDGEKHSTVRDGANFLHKLNSGSLLSASNTSYLLGLMKNQIYRGGIPSGVPGITVASKVGFYAGYKHDLAIIYAPRGTYILAAMSIGGNDAQFRDLSVRVYDFFDR